MATEQHDSQDQNQGNDLAAQAKVLFETTQKALDHVGQARQSFDEGASARGRQEARQALLILLELDTSMDRTQSTDLVQQLDSMYSHLEVDLAVANRDSNPERLQAVEQVLENLRDAWQKGMEGRSS